MGRPRKTLPRCRLRGPDLTLAIACHNFPYGNNVMLGVIKADQTITYSTSRGYRPMPAHNRKRPTVSVVLTTYNSEEFIDAALASVASQTLPPLEVLICDDGSSDQTIARAEAWHDRLRPTALHIIRARQNSGVSVSRNRGLLMSSGEVISFLDADDLYHTDHLALLAPALQAKSEVCLAFSNMSQTGIDVRTSGNMLDPLLPVLKSLSQRTGTHGLHVVDSRFRAHWIRSRRIAPSSWLLKREAIPIVGLFQPSLNYAEDSHFFFRALGLGGAVWSEHPTATKRTHGEQASSSKNAWRNEAAVVRALSMLRGIDPAITDEETLAIEAELDLACKELSHLAASSGIREYFKSRRECSRFVGRVIPLQPRHLIRAMLSEGKHQ